MMKGTIFDMDGTLLDSMPLWNHAGEIYLNQLGINAEPDLGKMMFPMSMEEGASYLRDTYHLPLSVTEIINGINRTIKGFYLYDAPLKPGVAELLKQLKARSIPMIVATATDRPAVEAALSRLGILGDFSAVLTCSEIGAGKEKPDIYLKAAEMIGSSPDTIWVFEDALHALQTAKKAGFKTVGVYDEVSADKQTELQKTSDYYLTDFNDFHALFAEIMK